MVRKIRKWFFDHLLIMLILLVLMVVILILSLPVIVAELIQVCLLGILFLILIKTYLKDRAEQKKYKNEDIQYNEEIIRNQYIDIVNEVIKEKNYESKQLNNEWIRIFNQLINVVINIRYSKKQYFSDFDVAACMIYSLVKDNHNDENILFAFECAKKIINEPKEYNLYMSYDNKVSIKVNKIYKKINMNLPDDNLSSLVSIIENYLKEETSSKCVVVLSDMLRIMYLKCVY